MELQQQQVQLMKTRKQLDDFSKMKNGTNQIHKAYGKYSMKRHRNHKMPNTISRTIEFAEHNR